MSNKKEEKIAYTISEFCEIVGISRSTLYEAWKNGYGPKDFKIGKKRFISRESALEWIRSLEGNQND